MGDPRALTWMPALGALLVRLAVVPTPASLCTLPHPRDVHFVSKNLRNVLHWLPPEGVEENKLTYKVKYLIYGSDRWIKNSECENISQTWCDLSLGTYDHKKLYYARVKAFSNGSCSRWTESPRFNPLTDTKIDPPEFYLSSTETTISICVVPPEKWKRNPKDRLQYLHQIYPGLQYNVSVFNKKNNKMWMFSIENNRLDVFHLESETVYCVRIQVYITPLMLSGFSKDNCIATLKGSTFKQIATIVLGYILPLFLIIIFILVSSCYVYRYVLMTKQRYPMNLVLKQGKKCLRDNLDLSEKVTVNFITINIIDDNKVSQQDVQQLDKAHSGTLICDGSSEQIGEQSEGADLDKETGSRSELDENKLLVTRYRFHQVFSKKDNEEVVYGCEVRLEDSIPIQGGHKKTFLEEDVLEGRVHNSEKLLPNLQTEEIILGYRSQFDLGSRSLFAVGQMGEIPLNKISCVPVELHFGFPVPSVNLVTEEPGQSFCPNFDVLADICLVSGENESFLNEKQVLSKEEQIFANIKTMSDGPQLAIWRSHNLWPRKKDEAEENQQSIIVDWNPQTRRLHLPFVSDLTNEAH